jgi:hypothetical protein
MHPREAFDHILEIRRQLASTGRFRGFRSTAVAAGGAITLLAAAAQPLVAPDPMNQLRAFLLLWTGVAAVSTLAVGAQW